MRKRLQLRLPQSQIITDVQYETNVLHKLLMRVHTINTLKCLLGSSRSVNIYVALI